MSAELRCLEPIEISDRDVAPQSAGDSHSVVTSRTEQRALCADRSRNCRCVDRLAHDDARVLLFFAQELDRDVGNLRELRRPALRASNSFRVE